MGKSWVGHKIGFGDVLALLKEIEETHAVKVRLSVVPRPSGGYQQGCIVLATPYHVNGRKMADIEAEQHLYPSTGHASREALEVYLLYRLLGLLDEREHQAVREEQMKDLGALTPLEQYIAKSF